jgi:hypothetical protein
MMIRLLDEILLPMFSALAWLAEWENGPGSADKLRRAIEARRKDIAEEREFYRRHR